MQCDCSSTKIYVILSYKINYIFIYLLMSVLFFILFCQAVLLWIPQRNWYIILVQQRGIGISEIKKCKSTIKTCPLDHKHLPFWILHWKQWCTSGFLLKAPIPSHCFLRRLHVQFISHAKSEYFHFFHYILPLRRNFSSKDY